MKHVPEECDGIKLKLNQCQSPKNQYNFFVTTSVRGQMYGYAPYHLTARSQVPSIDPAMHSTISFPGSSPRASTLPIHAPKEGISDVLASPQAHMGYRVPQTPVVPDRERSGQRGSSLIDMGTGYEANVKRTRHTVEAGRSRKRIISADAR